MTIQSFQYFNGTKIEKSADWNLEFFIHTIHTKKEDVETPLVVNCKGMLVMSTLTDFKMIRCMHLAPCPNSVPFKLHLQLSRSAPCVQSVGARRFASGLRGSQTEENLK